MDSTELVSLMIQIDLYVPYTKDLVWVKTLACPR